MITIDNNHVIDGVAFRRTASDAGLMIRKIGTEEIYSEAVDILGSTWTYEETDIPSEAENDASYEDLEAALQELGVSG